MTASINITKSVIGYQQYKISINFKIIRNVNITSDDKHTSIVIDEFNAGTIDIKYPVKYGCSHYIVDNTIKTIDTGVYNDASSIESYDICIYKDTDMICFLPIKKLSIHPICICYSKNKEQLIQIFTRVKEYMNEIDDNYISSVYFAYSVLRNANNEYRNMIMIQCQAYNICFNTECKGKLCGNEDCGVKTYRLDYIDHPVLNWYTKNIDEFRSVKKHIYDSLLSLSTKNEIELNTAFNPIIKKIDDTYISITYKGHKCIYTVRLEKLIKVIENIKEYKF